MAPLVSKHMCTERHRINRWCHTRTDKGSNWKPELTRHESAGYLLGTGKERYYTSRHQRCLLNGAKEFAFCVSSRHQGKTKSKCLIKSYWRFQSKKRDAWPIESVQQASWIWNGFKQNDASAWTTFYGRRKSFFAPVQRMVSNLISWTRPRAFLVRASIYGRACVPHRAILESQTEI